MAPTVDLSYRNPPLRLMPAAGCFGLALVLLIAGVVAVGGSLWSWIAAGAVAAAVGAALVIYLVRGNRDRRLTT